MFWKLLNKMHAIPKQEGWVFDEKYWRYSSAMAY